MVKVGDLAPDFSAVASDGQQVTLTQFKGQQPVVLFFYPADNSPVCTQEACSFRDAYEDFLKLGAVVIGVSGDSDETHRSFAASHRLPYIMVSDAKGTLRQLYDVQNFLYVLPQRVTFVIDLQGIVKLKFNSLLSGPQHVKEALEVVHKIAAKS